MKRTILALWGGVGLASLAIAGKIYYDSTSQKTCVGDMNIAPGTKLGAPFELTDHNGVRVSSEDLITEPTLLYMGYTFCPDVCPLDTARNAQAVTLLADLGIDVTPIMITIDPERDTPEVMKEFVSYIHPKMIGLTGSVEEIKAVANSYSAYAQKRDGDDPQYYLVDHSAFTYLVTPKGFVAMYDRALTEEQIAENIACHKANGDLDD